MYAQQEESVSPLELFYPSNAEVNPNRCIARRSIGLGQGEASQAPCLFMVVYNLVFLQKRVAVRSSKQAHKRKKRRENKGMRKM